MFVDSALRELHAVSLYPSYNSSDELDVVIATVACRPQHAADAVSCSKRVAIDNANNNNNADVNVVRCQPQPTDRQVCYGRPV